MLFEIKICKYHIKIEIKSKLSWFGKSYFLR